jgi:glycosyltransferase involved in cell wall biosynthesis
MSKKILIITDNVPEQINGVVTTFKSIETHAVLDGYNIVYLTPLQFVHFSCPGYAEVKLAFPWKIGKKIEEISPDYIHIATEGPIGLYARFYLDKRGYRYNTSYHTKFPEFLKKIYYIPEFITWSYLRFFHKHSGIVLANTQRTVEQLKKHGFTSDIVSWTRGVDRENLKPSTTYVFNKKPIVLYVGRVSKEKNLEALCEMHYTYNIEIVGDGPLRKKLQEKYPRVKFLGYQTGTELANSYARADVFCFPSKTDTFGIVMIEAMSLGTPVAAYPVDGPLDVISKYSGHMDNNLHKAILECLKLDRNKVEEASKKWTWEECWKIFKNNLVEIY